MTALFRNKRFISLLWGSMALYLLNISVDTPDPQSSLIPEDLSINDQESMVEVILEEILGLEDAIPEHDDPDSEEPENQKKGSDFKIESAPFNQMRQLSLNYLSAQKLRFPDFKEVLTEGHRLLITPPPQA